MSSFVGHALAPILVYAATEPSDAPRRAGWPLVLVGLALAPDADYLVRSLILPGSPPIRVTHSLLGSLVLPALVVLGMVMMGARGRTLRLRAVQAAAAGVSHVVLDLLVGVTPAALLWPFSTWTARLPLGVLPSAGRLSLANPYLHRNLAIELGVLLPLLAIVLLARSRPRSKTGRWMAMGGLAMVSLAFMLLSARLAR